MPLFKSEKQDRHLTYIVPRNGSVRQVIVNQVVILSLWDLR